MNARLKGKKAYWFSVFVFGTVKCRDLKPVFFNQKWRTRYDNLFRKNCKESSNYTFSRCKKLKIPWNIEQSTKIQI
jgi:hypothetical protein